MILNNTYIILIPMPIAATIIIASACMSKSDFTKRSTARYINTPVRIHITDIDSKAPNTSIKRNAS